MRTLLVGIACLLFGIGKVYPQNVEAFGENYYKETKTFVMDEYTYQCDVQSRSQFVTLYNKENKWTYEDQVYKNTGKYYAPSISEEKKLNPIVDDAEMTRKTLSIVDNAFTELLAKQMGENVFVITMFLDPKTGKVVEVLFNLATFSPYAKVPLSVYRDIEVQLKENISYTPTTVGKQLNYIMLSWSQTPIGRHNLVLPPVDSIDEPFTVIE